MSESTEIAVTIVTSVLIITSIAGNSFVCAIIKKNRDMRNPIDYLLVNLAVADIIYTTFSLPGVVLGYTNSHPEGVTGKVFCIALTRGTITWVGAFSSVLTLVAIATERYLSVIYPVGGKGKFTMRRLKIIIPCFWVFSLFLQIPGVINMALDNEFRKRESKFCTMRPLSYKNWLRKGSFFLWFSMVVISIAVMIGLYSRVVYSLWTRNNNVELTHRQKAVLKVRKRVTLMIVTVSAIFGITWLPDTIMHTVEVTTSLKFGPVVFPIVHTIIMFNCAVNPFVYALINQRFREKMRRMLYCSSRLLEPRSRSKSQSHSIELVITQPRA
ncbi:unnamed protein product [Porites evermanni]|uniref:G-protein coupled receptors family 1 profile domain-containing protein n=1 Tax=Porites evermanni TaxID=104178 RepID=A0ABN8SPB0_9CNID|nr:unnamed protein product [Porites evermanni]